MHQHIALLSYIRHDNSRQFSLFRHRHNGVDQPKMEARSNPGYRLPPLDVFQQCMNRRRPINLPGAWV